MNAKITNEGFQSIDSSGSSVTEVDCLWVITADDFALGVAASQVEISFDSFLAQRLPDGITADNISSSACSNDHFFEVFNQVLKFDRC